MNWTREKPTQPGWYWLRWGGLRDRPYDYRTEMVEVRNYPSDLQVFQPTWITSRPLEDFDGLWAGPLVPPQGEE